MSTHNTDISIIYEEVLWLLIACYIRHRMDDSPGVKFETRWGLGCWLFARDSIFESIVMRACRLDDTGSNWSFGKAQERLNGTIRDQKRIKSIMEAIGQYRKDINPMKVYIRNNGLVHIPIDAKDKIDAIDPIPMLRSACRIVDLLSDAKQSFSYSCGAHEKVDLRDYFKI